MTETVGGSVSGRALRVGGIAVLVVVAVVGARARAAGMTPPLPAPQRSIIEMFMRIGALTVMTAAMILLLWGRRARQVVVAAGPGRKRKVAAVQPNRRVLIAGLVGLLLAIALQLLGNTANDNRKPEAAPPAPPGQEQRTDPNARERGQPQAGVEHGIGDVILLVVGALTLGALIFVLVRRDSVVIEEEPAEDEEEAVARAVRAGRAAVADRTITDPREAIVACFAAMEAGLARRGGEFAPQEADTPWEVLHRGIEAGSLPAGAASTLLQLFREARYSTHPMNQGDRADADAALGELLGGLRTPAAGVGGENR